MRFIDLIPLNHGDRLSKLFPEAQLGPVRLILSIRFSFRRWINLYQFHTTASPGGAALLRRPLYPLFILPFLLNFLPVPFALECVHFFLAP